MRRYVYGDARGVSRLLIRSWMLNWLVKRERREAAGMERANMTAKRLRYPVGIQTFSEVRTNGYVYVDKTSYIYDLAHWSGKTFFLSQPRRFGKSLLISTMQAYFEGRYELFEGLAVSELEGGEWESYPVIRVDLSTVKTTDCDQLVQLLEWAFSGLEDKWGRNPDAKTPGSRFMALVQAAHKQTGKQVVVLVDEYDSPLLNVTHDAEKLQAFREVMREFYAPLKACDEILRFVFLSGITKFSQLSIFSELNNLTNISMLPQFAGVCGITEEELLGQMGEGVQGLAQGLGITYDEAFAQLKANYDGYHFSKVSPDIYNPFSLLSALANTDVSAYWFSSGTPSFLIRLLETRGWDIAGLEGSVARALEFDAPAERLTSPLPMLYQGGYLTIKGYNPRRDAYTLGIPNEEVCRGLSERLVQHAAPEALHEHYGFLDNLADKLYEDDIEGALACTKSYLAGIPYHLGSRDERGFETTFFLIFDLLGIQIETEFKTATDRVDAVIRTDSSVFVLEFKYDKSAEAALAQIDDKGYMLPFARDGRKLCKVGVNFSGELQTIDSWIVEWA